jgi:hypothetical protein
MAPTPSASSRSVQLDVRSRSALSRSSAHVARLDVSEIEFVNKLHECLQAVIGMDLQCTKAANSIRRDPHYAFQTNPGSEEPLDRSQWCEGCRAQPRHPDSQVASNSKADIDDSHAHVQAKTIAWPRPSTNLNCQGRSGPTAPLVLAITPIAPPNHLIPNKTPGCHEDRAGRDAE